MSTSNRREDEPKIKGIQGCQIDKDYVPRAGVVSQLRDWFRTGKHPLCFVIGEAGIGKTNLLLHALTRDERLKDTPAVFLSFRGYDEAVGLKQQLIGYLPRELTRRFSQQALFATILDRQVMVVLDGLDELARSRGEGAVHRVATDLIAIAQEAKELRKHPRIVVTCRDHELRRLQGVRVLGEGITRIAEEISIGPLDKEKVKEQIVALFPEPSSKGTKGTVSESEEEAAKRARIVESCCRPLFLEVVRRMPEKKRRDLLEADSVAAVYDKWYDHVISERKSGNSAGEEDPWKPTSKAAKTDVAKIAICMLKERKDLIQRSDLPKSGKANRLSKCIDHLTIDADQPTGIFVREIDRLTVDADQPIGKFRKEKDETYAFVHQSLREFILAWAARSEIEDCKFDIMSQAPAFDYVGAELYRCFDELGCRAQQHFTALKALVANKCRGLEGEEPWNRVVCNVLEGIGMLEDGQSPKRLNETIRNVLAIAQKKAPRYVRYRTRYNAARCLERLHPSSPKPHFREVVLGTPGCDLCYAATIRGFHLPQPKPGVYHNMAFSRIVQGEIATDLEQTVSEGLLGIISQLRDEELAPDAEYLKINCTLALIRWLPDDFEDWDVFEEPLRRHPDDRWTQLNVFRLLKRNCRDKTKQKKLLRLLPRVREKEKRGKAIQKHTHLTKELDAAFRRI